MRNFPKFHETFINRYLEFSKTDEEFKSLLDKNDLRKDGTDNCLCFPIVGVPGGEFSGLEAIGDSGFVKNNFCGRVLADFELAVRALFVNVSFGSGFKGLMAGFGVSLALAISSEGFLKTIPDAFISSLKKLGNSSFQNTVMSSFQ